MKISKHLAEHAVSELLQMGYTVEGDRLNPPERLSDFACKFFRVAPTAQAAPAATPRADSQPALPKITAEDRSFLHYNPNTDDVVKWVQDYACAAVSADRATRAPADSGAAPAAGAVAELDPVGMVPVAEVVECEKMGQQALREIDGRWRWLSIGERLYARADTGIAAAPTPAAQPNPLRAALLKCIAAIERTAHCSEADRLAAADEARQALAQEGGA